MERICFHLRVRPGRMAEYRQRHAQVWPEMQEALRASGWGNYSLFLADDGLLTGYLECEDFEESVRAMAGLDVNTRWQAEMAGFFEDMEGDQPDRAIRPVPEIFHID